VKYLAIFYAHVTLSWHFICNSTSILDVAYIRYYFKTTSIGKIYENSLQNQEDIFLLRRQKAISAVRSLNKVSSYCITDLLVSYAQIALQLSRLDINFVSRLLDESCSKLNFLLQEHNDSKKH